MHNNPIDPYGYHGAKWEPVIVNLFDGNMDGTITVSKQFTNAYKFINIVSVGRSCTIATGTTKAEKIADLQYGDHGQIELPNLFSQLVISWNESTDFPIPYEESVSDTFLILWLSNFRSDTNYQTSISAKLRSSLVRSGLLPSDSYFTIPFTTIADAPVASGPVLLGSTDEDDVDGNDIFIPWGNATGGLDGTVQSSQIGAVSLFDQDGFPIPAGKFTRTSYGVSFDRNATPYRNAAGLAANTETAIVALWKPSSSGRTTRVRRLQLAIHSNTAAAELFFRVRFLDSTQPTGGTANTPQPLNRGNVAADTECRSNPTAATAVPTGNDIQSGYAALGITGAASVVNPPPFLVWDTLFDDNGTDTEPLILRQGTSEGIAITVESDVATTFRYIARAYFTED
jgi:hypothetical protein